VTLSVGDAIGGFRLVERLGEGPQAVVYKAYQSALDRPVTLKVLKEDFQRDPGVRLRFQQEAQQSARLDHPNILPIHDFVSQAGELFLVMKFVEAETLRGRLERGPLPVPEAARMVGGVGAALQYAHKRSLLHGDLKPSNILLGSDGNVLVTDFGVTRIVTGDLTHSAPEYISPEQARAGADLDGRADQYALGVVLFEALTGVLPFRGADARGVIHQHLISLPPRPSAINPALTRPIEDVILTALSKDPEKRYTDVLEMTGAFQRATAPPRPPTAPLRNADFTAMLPATSDLPAEGEGKGIQIMLTSAGGHVFQLTGKSEYILGRSEPTRAHQPDVDLADLRGMELGVSRKHGRLHFDRGNLYYTDLKSTNGSRVNGAGLYSEIPLILEDGDELCLGKLVFRIYFGA
jgi:serine/threonine protein kinase